MPSKIDLNELPEKIRQLIPFYEKQIRAELGNTAKEFADEMRESGTPIVYPVQWDSEKQRRAFFATDGFGKGIPYRRTGEYERGWKTAELPNGWQISNKHPAGAIGGTVEYQGKITPDSNIQTWQSRIHRGRWKSTVETLKKMLGELPGRILNRLRMSSG